MYFKDYLPTDLRDSAYCSGEECAWSKDDALRVIEYASQLDVAVCGIEIWLPTIPGPTIPSPFFYNWSIEPKADSRNWNDYVNEANRKARDYVQSFQRDEKDTLFNETPPYFNLTVMLRPGE